MKHQCVSFVFLLVMFLTATTADAININSAGPIGASLSGDAFGHIDGFTVGGKQHVNYVSYFLSVNGAALIEVIQGGNFNDIADNPNFFEPGQHLPFQYSNVIQSIGGDYAIGFGINLRDPSRSSGARVSWEPTMQITNTSADPITFQAIRYTQGIGSVSFVDSDGIAGSADDVAFFVRNDGAQYVEPFGLTTSRQLGTGGAVLAAIRAAGPGFVLGGNTNAQAAPGESAFMTESFTIPPGGRTITNYIVEVIAAGVANLTPLGVSANFAAVGSSGDGKAGGLLISSELTGIPSGGIQNVQAPLTHVSSVRRWSFATTILPGSGAQLDVTFEYDPATDGVGNEATLQLATRSLLNDVWVQWPNVVRNPAANTITATGVTEDALGDQWILAATGADNALPVTLSRFVAQRDGDTVRLRWTTASETNNLGFAVYRRAGEDGEWRKVGWVPSDRNTPLPRDYTFTDEPAPAETAYDYYLADIDIFGQEIRSHVIEAPPWPERPSQNLIPRQSTLLPNFPNPFNPETWLPYELASDASVTMHIFDGYGRPVREFAVGKRPAGSYLTRQTAIYWDGRDAAGQPVGSGVYFYQLQADDFRATRKMVILK